MQQWLSLPPSLNEVIQSPLFALTLTLSAFWVGNQLYRLSRNFPLLHPTVSGAVIIALLLPQLGLSYQRYASGAELVTFFLGTATVALAVPLYTHFHLIRRLAIPIMITTVVGASFACLSAVAIASWLGASDAVLLSLAPKSITTPIALEVSRAIGGITTLATGAVVFTGAIGITLAPLAFWMIRLRDPRAQGFTLGLAAHGVGTARAFERNATAGAFASLALCLTGVVTAAVLPSIAPWLIRWF